MATITLRSIKGSPLTITEMDDNFTALNTDIGNRVLTSTYTATDVLDKIKTVDGSGSGLDADLLDGKNSASTDTINTIVARDGSGNFAANQITATTFVGSFTTPTTGSFSLAGSSSGSITLAVPSSAGSNTITFPATTGNVVTTGDSGTVTNAMLAGSIANSKLVNSSITIDGNAVSLGGSISIASGNITWTGTQTFIDDKLLIVDNVDTSKKLALQISNIGTGTTRTLTAPDADGTIATREYVAGGNGAGSFTTFSTNSVITAGEKTTVSATSATGTIQYDVLTQSILYYTTNASGNWTLNLRGNGSTTLNSVMAIGETRTITFLAVQGSTAYYQTGLTIDGSSVTPRWQNGVTLTSGNINGIDVYTLAIIKTAASTFTVLESSTKFA
jgi:hypothetical protein